MDRLNNMSDETEDQDNEQPRDNVMKPILDTLASLQRQIAAATMLNNTGSRQLSPEDILKSGELPDLHESALNHKGNKDQYKFCRVLLGLMDATQTCLTADADTATLHGYIQAMQEFTRNRIKMIRMADRSESGWSVIQHYETDRIADDDSEDEKRIKAAEKTSCGQEANFSTQEISTIRSYDI